MVKTTTRLSFDRRSTLTRSKFNCATTIRRPTLRPHGAIENDYTVSPNNYLFV